MVVSPLFAVAGSGVTVLTITCGAHYNKSGQGCLWVAVQPDTVCGSQYSAKLVIGTPVGRCEAMMTVSPLCAVAGSGVTILAVMCGAHDNQPK